MTWIIFGGLFAVTVLAGLLPSERITSVIYHDQETIGQRVVKAVRRHGA